MGLGRRSLTGAHLYSSHRHSLPLTKDEIKAAEVATASQKKYLFEGCKNHMTIENSSRQCLRLRGSYLESGTMKVPPKDELPQMTEDKALFAGQSSLTSRSCSGVVSYDLDDKTVLHILWDCPYNFSSSDNFVALLLDHEEQVTDMTLFHKMHQNTSYIFKIPRPGSEFDLVCCGPSDGFFTSGKYRDVWGVKRMCVVENSTYKVTAAMGDTHNTNSLVTVWNKKEF